MVIIVSAVIVSDECVIGLCGQSVYNRCAELVGWIKHQQPVFGNHCSLSCSPKPASDDR